MKLADQRCQGLPPGTAALDKQKIEELLKQVPGWEFKDGGLVKAYRFADYGRTMTFVNAVAWIAHREDHHPDMTVSYDRCTIILSTHSIGGISMNDFILAAKIEALL